MRPTAPVVVPGTEGSSDPPRCRGLGQHFDADIANGKTSLPVLQMRMWSLQRGASVRGKLGQSEANLFARQWAKDLGMPIGQARKLVWHLAPVTETRAVDLEEGTCGVVCALSDSVIATPLGMRMPGGMSSLWWLGASH